MLGLNRYLSVLLVLVALGFAASVESRSPLTQEYTVEMKHVARYAEQYGFKFEVDNQTVGQGLSKRGSVNCISRLKRTTCSGTAEMSLPTSFSNYPNLILSINKNRTTGLACTSQVPLGRDDEPKPAGCWSNFHLFKGKKLTTGWSLKAADIQGARWQSRPAAGSGYFVVKLEDPQGTNGSNAQVRSITLVGPTNRSWHEAFNGNYRK